MTEITGRLSTALGGRYKIERHLGEGGMATVYLAHDTKHDRKVALKVLKPELAAVIGGERFVQEIRVTANLQHPNILALYDSGEADSFLYYVMPYVDGESLRDKLEREKQLAVDESVKIAQSIAAALDYAHAQGIVHRDIKPENILLHAGQALVADFGIALAISAAAGHRMTETGLSVGTPHYMSPEQASADRELDGRSDIYSLGATLYEMLAGEPPFTAPSAQAIVAKILTEEPGLVSENRPSVPSHVAAAVQQALAKLPADRFGTAAQFGEALANPSFTASGATAAAPVVAAAPPGHRLNPITAAVMLVLAAVAVFGWMRGTPDVERRVLRLELDVGDVIPDQSSDLLVSPDGSMFAMAARAQGGRQLFVRRADEDAFRPLPGTENARYPAFSPTGEWIVFTDFLSNGLSRVAVGGGSALTVVPDGAYPNPYFPHWGDDGTIVFRGATGLFRVPETGGDVDTLIEGGSWAFFPRLLPGGRGVLFTDARNRSVHVFDLEADSIVPLLTEGVDAMYVRTGHLVYAHPDGGMFAVAFDVEALTITGQPVPVLDHVWIGVTPGGPLRAHFSVADDGTVVYGSGEAPQGGGGNSRLVIRRFSGDTVTVPLAPRAFSSPRWSPDGRSIAYSSGDASGFNIYVYDVEVGATPRQLTFEGLSAALAWSPDGASIAFSGQRDSTLGWDVFVKSVYDDSPESQLFSADAEQIVRGWPEEDLIVLEGGGGGGFQTDLWIAKLSANAEVTPYLQSEADVEDIAISPDGNWAAYQSNETGTEAVYVRSFPVPRQQIPVSDGSGQFPRWSPDGRTIYYWHDEGALVDTLWAAHVEYEPTFAVVSREPVLVGSYAEEEWDLHPAGDRIIAAAPLDAGSNEERVLVVVNWFDELLARLGSH